jgi:hypothetical protein
MISPPGKYRLKKAHIVLGDHNYADLLLLHLLLRSVRVTDLLILWILLLEGSVGNPGYKCHVQHIIRGIRTELTTVLQC